MSKNHFHRQEGAEQLHDLHVTAHILRAKECLAMGAHDLAVKDMLLADEYPENHMVGKDTAYSRNPQIYYYTGLAYELGGEKKLARELYQKSIAATSQDPANRYYKALSYQKLKKDREAEALLEEIIRTGEERISSTGEVDFFAKFGEDLTESQRQAAGYYLMGLGYMGKAEASKAREYLDKASSLDVGQLWARVYLEELTHGQ